MLDQNPEEFLDPTPLGADTGGEGGMRGGGDEEGGDEEDFTKLRSVF